MGSGKVSPWSNQVVLSTFLHRCLGTACVFAIAAAAFFPFAAPSVAADDNLSPQDTLKLRMGLGVGAAPGYVGSDDYRVIPLPNFELSYAGYALRSSRLGVEADLVGITGLDAGPIIRYDLGRSSDVDDSVVALLPEVDGSVELGGFVGVGAPLSVIGLESSSILAARVEYLQGLDGGHEGATAAASLSLISPVTDSLTLISSLSTTYMSGNYADSYFDVSALGSAASGLPIYDAGAGFRDLGVTFIANYELNENWSVNGVGSFTRLIGDAAASPIVTERGSSNQFLGGLGFSYTFE
jgi:MipA family protein